MKESYEKLKKDAKKEALAEAQVEKAKADKELKQLKLDSEKKARKEKEAHQEEGTWVLPQEPGPTRPAVADHPTRRLLCDASSR